MRIARLMAALAAAVMMVTADGPLAQAQPPPSAAPQEPVSPWTFLFAPYGWATFISGTETVKGQTLTVASDPVSTFADSQSVLALMAYSELRYRDRIGLFTDLVYANLTAGQSATRNFSAPGVSGSAVASASVNYQSLILMFGAAYEVVKVGPDRSAEGPGMAGVGQTAFDIVLGGRWWYQQLDLTLNFYGAVTVTAPNLTLSANRSQVIASSGSIGWVDPLVGFRVRHKLAQGQTLWLEADMGGFGIGSRISAQAQLAYAYEFGNALGISWAGVLGYRALYVDYTQGSGNSFFEMNLVQHGPLLGVRGRF
jgi:hypothetical protein